MVVAVGSGDRREVQSKVWYAHEEVWSDVTSVLVIETEFKEAVEDLEDAITNYEDPGCELYSVEEVIDDPKDIAASDDMTMPNGKRKFKFGEIKKTTKEEREMGNKLGIWD